MLSGFQNQDLGDAANPDGHRHRDVMTGAALRSGSYQGRPELRMSRRPAVKGSARPFRDVLAQFAADEQAWPGRMADRTATCAMAGRRQAQGSAGLIL